MDDNDTMVFAYADPPYLGCGKRYAEHHQNALQYDDPLEHKKLIERLCDEYPSGWSYSLSSVTLRTLLPFCPADVRVMAWIKPFVAFKGGVNPAYSWEPVIVRGGRRLGVYPKLRDFCSASITLKKGLTGAKPDDFWLWLFAIMGARTGDTFVDVFPGTGRGTEMWKRYVRQTSLF